MSMGRAYYGARKAAKSLSDYLVRSASTAKGLDSAPVVTLRLSITINRKGATEMFNTIVSGEIHRVKGVPYVLGDRYNPKNEMPEAGCKILDCANCTGKAIFSPAEVSLVFHDQAKPLCTVCLNALGGVDQITDAQPEKKRPFQVSDLVDLAKAAKEEKSE